jgi:hypothetical protein
MLSRLRAVATVLVFVLFVISLGVFAFVIGDFLGDDSDAPDSGDTTPDGTPPDERSDDGHTTDDGPENRSAKATPVEHPTEPPPFEQNKPKTAIQNRYAQLFGSELGGAHVDCLHHERDSTLTESVGRWSVTGETP